MTARELITNFALPLINSIQTRGFMEFRLLIISGIPSFRVFSDRIDIRFINKIPDPHRLADAIIHVSYEYERIDKSKFNISPEVLYRMEKFLEAHPGNVIGFWFYKGLDGTKYMNISFIVDNYGIVDDIDIKGEDL